MITSVTLGGLEIGDSTKYALHRESLASLQAGYPREALLTPMQARSPVFNRSQPEARPIILIVMLLEKQWDTRRNDFLALEAAGGSGTLVPLSFVEDSVTKTYSVHCGGAVPDGWYYRATIAATAPDPIPA